MNQSTTTTEKPTPKTTDEILIERIKIQRELTKRACLENYYDFLRYFWSAIIPEPMIDNWHIKILCDELQIVGDWVINRKPAEYDLVINVPPGTTKTTIVTIGFPAWLWLNDPTVRTISGSYSAEIAIDHAVRSRKILKSYKFQELYGDLIEFSRDQDNKSYYENIRGGSRAACGVGGAITGKHGHLLLIDDPINPKQSSSEVFRKTANDWMDKTLSTRKIDKAKTPTILIMQRLHEEDPTGYRLQKGKVRHICLPAELTDLDNVRPRELEKHYVDGLLDPVRMDRDVLKWAREQMGSAEYAGQFLQSPVAAEGNIVKREWFRFYKELPTQTPQRIVQSWDTAFKKGQDNDFSVCTTWFEFADGFYLANLYQKKVEYPELKRKVPELGLMWRSHYVLIEDTASGQVLIQELKTEGKISIIAIKVDTDKTARIKTATPAIEAGKVFFPETDWINIVLDQLCGFPNTKHDDIVDSISQFLNWARENPFDVPYAIGRKRSESSKLLKGFNYGGRSF